jgi:uncharacterized protein YdaU (DUF1376 family)
MKIAAISIADYAEATEGMPHDAERLFIRILLKMYSREDGLPDSDEENSVMFGYKSVRPYRRLKESLLSFPCGLYIDGDTIRHERVEDEIETVKLRRQQSVHNGSKGGRPKNVSAKFEGSLPEVSPKFAPSLPETLPKQCADQQAESTTYENPSPSPSPKDTTLTHASTPVRKTLPEKSKIEAMTEALTKAAGNALNPTSPNVMMIADPLNWIDHGADFERDILPAVGAAAQKCRPQSVNTWGYFAGAVKDAMHRRIETGKSFSEAPKPSASSSRKPSEHEINSAYLANVMKQPIPAKLVPVLD